MGGPDYDIISTLETRVTAVNAEEGRGPWRHHRSHETNASESELRRQRMPAAHDEDEVLEAFPADRTDPLLSTSILL
jgi:outer membrane protein assembly factor BamB